MKIAFISDIHANFPALCAAIAEAEKMGADEIIAAGDMIGGGPHPVEVVRALSGRSCRAVAGNIERKVLAMAGHSKMKKHPGKNIKKANIAWTRSRLGPDEIGWLSALPGSLRMNAGGTETLVVHGSPRNDTDYIYPSVTRRALSRFMDGVETRLLVCGHSHIPFFKSVGGVKVVNCGSVGRPVDGDNAGSFALVEFGETYRINVKIVRFSYDISPVIEDLRSRETPGFKEQEYRDGVKRGGA
ncbi:MAG TPA: metallophosphoesterase [Spirochaetes bacterium]|nr:metallophosphoesterase [Spirochaetota bacterium]